MPDFLPITLAIDTAAPRLQLALLGNEGIVDILVEDMTTGQAEAIFPAIAQLMRRNGLGYADIQRVVTTTGPGSFTGLRIAISAARGIALARGIPVIGIPSPLALSLSADGPCRVLLDARRGEAYSQIFTGPGEPAGPPILSPIAKAEADLAPGDVVICTPFVDIAALARFGARCDPRAWPPEAAYVRDADAKPQTAARIARQTP